ncbi:MAG: FAD-dependent oxidoreductase, partial [Bacteroidota bacterium]
IVSWGTDPWAGGSQAYFAPGQIRDFVPAMTRPHGRLYFAGSHTAVGSAGMEGALESAERAVEQATT